MDLSALLAIAGIISAVGVTVLFFRIQRELQMKERNERTWIPWADRLAFGATFLSMLVLAVTLIDRDSSSRFSAWLAPLLVASVVLVIGYAPAILAHYRLLGGPDVGPRDNPEPVEKWIVWGTLVLATIAAYVAR